MTHREAIKAWLANINIADQFVIDWGSGSKPVSRYINHTNCKFITIDQNKLIASDRRSQNHYTHNIQQPIELGDADTAFCMEVLEHTLRPDLVLQNIYNNLKTSGAFYMSMPYDFPIHSDDDYIRFTDNGLKAWLEKTGFTIIDFGYSVGHEGYLVKAIK